MKSPSFVMSKRPNLSTHVRCSVLISVSGSVFVDLTALGLNQRPEHIHIDKDDTWQNIPQFVQNCLFNSCFKANVTHEKVTLYHGYHY